MNYVQLYVRHRYYTTFVWYSTNAFSTRIILGMAAANERRHYNVGVCTAIWDFPERHGIAWKYWEKGTNNFATFSITWRCHGGPTATVAFLRSAQGVPSRSTEFCSVTEHSMACSWRAKDCQMVHRRRIHSGARGASGAFIRRLHRVCASIPHSKVHGANMGPSWGRQDPGGPHVGNMNLAIWDLRKSLLGILQKSWPRTLKLCGVIYCLNDHWYW